MDAAQFVGIVSVSVVGLIVLIFIIYGIVLCVQCCRRRCRETTSGKLLTLSSSPSQMLTSTPTSTQEDETQTNEETRLRDTENPEEYNSIE